MAKTKKRATAKPVVKKRPTGPAKPTKVIVKKRHIESALAGIEAWCSTLRMALEVYDGKKDTATLYIPGPYHRVVGPWPFEFFDCIPGRGPVGPGSVIDPGVMELMGKLLEALNRERGQIG